MPCFMGNNLHETRLFLFVVKHDILVVVTEKRNRFGGFHMFGKRCTLCGGRVNAENICVECGLNNKKYEPKYILNRSSCDAEPLTHVHKEDDKERTMIINRYQTGFTNTRKKNVDNAKPKKFRRFLIWGIFAFILFEMLIGAFVAFVELFF